LEDPAAVILPLDFLIELEERGSRFFELALLLVRSDHVASVIVNADHRIM
jgi:hypothetical protein